MLQWGAVVLAGGKGSRMGGDTPKVLRPICGIPMLRLVVDVIGQTGIADMVIVVPEEHEGIQLILPREVEFAIQEHQLGTGDALSSALGFLHSGSDSNILVINGDVPLLDVSTIRNLIEEHTATQAVMSVLTANGEFSNSLGSIARDDSGQVVAIVEGDRFSKDSEQREINVGVYCFRVDWLLQNITKLNLSKSGEFYITELVEIACRSGKSIGSIHLRDISQALGINTLADLADAEDVLRSRIRNYWIDHGVYIMDRQSVQIDWTVSIGQGTSVLPNTIILSETIICDNCEIGPGSMIRDSRIGNGCKVVSSVIEGAIVENAVEIGPFSHLRNESHIESEVHIGNYAEVKASRIGHGSKMGHFSYMGDAEIGSNVNIGAGTITCNFDGAQKHRTIIGNDVFLGSDTMLVAPIKVGDRASTGAGAVVTKDVPPDVLVTGVPARVVPKQV